MAVTGVHSAMSDGVIFEHMIDRAEGDGVRRMDVVVSGGGRRSWAPDVKARIIAESMVPGANVAEVARRIDMKHTTAIGQMVGGSG
jgi:hypothetical protein